MNRLLIEGYELDPSEMRGETASFAVDDLRNIDSKSTNSSKTIVLPGTARNNEALGNIFEFNISNDYNAAVNNVLINFNASKQAQCRILAHGSVQIFKGVFRLLEIIIDRGTVEYECQVVGELGGLTTALGNKKVQDIDFSAYNHTYGTAAITASWDAALGTGYYYGLIDYGNVSTNKVDFQLTAFRPQLYMAEIFDRIITGAGYTYESAFTQSAFFKRQTMPNNQKVFSRYSDNALSAISAADTVSDYVYNVVLGYAFNGTIITSFTNANPLFPNVAGASTYNYNFAFSGNMPTVPNNWGFEVALRVTYAPVDGGTIVTLNSFNMMPGEEFSVDWAGSVYIPLNAVIAVEMTYFGTEPTDFVEFTVDSASLVLRNGVQQIVPLGNGDTVIMNDTIPRGILQKDFFVSVLKMFNLMAVDDPLREKHLIIEPWPDFYDNTVAGAEDWNQKIDYGMPVRLKPMSELNARFYKFAYKQDNDFYNEEYRKKYGNGYGDRVFDTVYDFSSDEDKLEVIFSASVLYGASGTDKVYPAIYKKSNAGAAEDAMDHNVRVMQVKKITGVASWKILSGVTVLATLTDYGYCGHLDDPDAPNADINFGAPEELYFGLVTGNLSNNLFNAYYSPYLYEITDKDSRLLTANFKLTKLDIFALDFTKLKRINGGLWRLQKVIDYDLSGDELTKCELVKVITWD